MAATGPRRPAAGVTDQGRRDDALKLLRFIDWLIRLPRPLELALRQALADLEEQTKMSYVTSWERFAREEGREEGEQRGEAKAMLRLLQVKFGPPAPEVESLIQAAEPAQLDLWLTRILTEATPKRSSIGAGQPDASLRDIGRARRARSCRATADSFA